MKETKIAKRIHEHLAWWQVPVGLLLLLVVVWIVLWNVIDDPRERWAAISSVSGSVGVMAALVVGVAAVISFLDSHSKPDLRVVFDDGGQACAETLRPESNVWSYTLRFYVANEADKAAVWFRITIDLGSLPGMRQTSLHPAWDKDDQHQLVRGSRLMFDSLGSRAAYRDEKLDIGAVPFSIYPEGLTFRESFELPYSIHGDWGKVKKGVLTVKLRKP